MCSKLLQWCLTLCDPMNCSPPGSSVHGMLQARILEWVACPPPVDLSHPGIKAVSLMSPRLLRLLHWQAGTLQLAPPGTPLSLSFSHTYVRVYTESLCCTTEINTTL